MLKSFLTILTYQIISGRRIWGKDQWATEQVDGVGQIDHLVRAFLGVLEYELLD